MRASSEVATPPPPADGEVPVATSLWSLPDAPPDPMDHSIRTTGMWAESDAHLAAVPSGTPYARSARARPWGPAPGLAEVPRGFSEMPRPRGQAGSKG